MNIGNVEFNFSKRTYIMGILNITPDSFSDGGVYSETCKAVDRALEMFEQGADIVDIGGESTRPGAQAIPVQEELGRVIPVIEAIRMHTDQPLSIDTRKSRVARAAIDAGVDLVNDISGLKYDESMAALIAERDVPVVIMHSCDDPAVMQTSIAYENLIHDIQSFLRDSIQLATSKGVDDNRIILDPGIGFGKTVHHNFEIIHQLRQFVDMGYPVLMGVSRKSFIGKSLDLKESERRWGTAAAVTASVLNGGHIMRVHDVSEMRQVINIADRIKNPSVTVMN